MFVDTHCHLLDKAYSDDVDDVIERARSVGVSQIICVSSTTEDVHRMNGFLTRSEALYGTVGIHPHNAVSATPKALDDVKEGTSLPRVVAVGETGLDYHYDFSPRDTQLASLHTHLALAEETGLPLVLHSREAVSDTIEFLKEAKGRARGVVHCFSGPEELLTAALDADWMVSFTGIATFSRFDRDLLSAVPADRYMLETDGPYLAPVPFRGKRNEPSFLPHIPEAVAAVRQISVEDVARETNQNAADLFGVRGA